MQNESLFSCTYAKESFQIKILLPVCFDLKPVISVSIIFNVKLLECEREDGRKGQGNKTDFYTRKLPVNSFSLEGGQMS